MQQVFSNSKFSMQVTACLQLFKTKVTFLRVVSQLLERLRRLVLKQEPTLPRRKKFISVLGCRYAEFPIMNC